MFRHRLRSYLAIALALGLSFGNAPLALAGVPTPPAIEAVSPTTAVAGVATTFTAFESNLPATSAWSCALYVNNQSVVNMSPSGAALALNGNVTASYTFSSAGTYTVQARCWDPTSDTPAILGQASTVTVSATAPSLDTTGPIIGEPTPLTVTAGSAVTISASYADTGSGVSSCTLFALQPDSTNGTGPNVMNRTGTASNGIASWNIQAGIFTSNYTLQISCTDVSGNSSSVTRTVTLSNSSVGDTTPPVVSSFAPVTAVVGTATTFTASYSDAGTGVNNCYLLVDGSSGPLLMTRSGTGASGTVSRSYTFPAAGTFSAGVQCGDVAGNANTPALVSVVANDVVRDTVAPTVGQVAPTVATVGVQQAFTVTYSDSGSGVASCEYSYILGGGGMSRSGTAASGVASGSITFTSVGTYTMRVSCTDVAGNISTIVPTTITVSATAPSDTTAPTVGVITPLIATAGAPVTFTVSYSDAGTGVSACYLNAHALNGSGGFENLPMTRTGTAASGTATYTSVASWGYTSNYLVSAVCVDGSGNTTPIVNRTVVVSPASSGTDTVAPTVGVVTPLTATAGVSTLFTATASDVVGITACSLYPDAVNFGAMIRGSGTTLAGVYSLAYTFPTSGPHTVQVRCTDTAGNIGVSTLTTITVSATSVADTTVPVVSTLSPTTVNRGANTTFTATVTDNSSGVSACYLYRDTTYMGTMTLSTGSLSRTATYLYAFSDPGTYRLRVECTDASGNRGVGAYTSLVVSSTSSVTDTTAPAVGILYPTSVNTGANTNYTVSVTDSQSGVNACYLYMETSYIGTMTLSGNAANTTASYQYVFGAPGTYRLRVECTDTAGNRSVGSTTSITVGSTNTYQPPVYPTNPAAPVISSVYPSQVGVGAQTSYAVTFTSNNIGVNGCSFYVNGVYTGAMGLSGSPMNGAGNFLHAFSTPGTYQLQVQCVDSAGNRGYGPSSMLSVTGGYVAPTNPSTPTNPVGPTAPTFEEARSTLPGTGSLIKLPCFSNAAPTDPCKAVYYYGRDGKRHAFPNEHVFFTWYSNFDRVIVVAGSAVASAPLGANVTYRPGVRLIKFPTVPQVYAVTRGGALRWVSSEQVAIALYGSNWNRSVDDVADAFYSNYTYGSNITNSSQYSPSAETNATLTIDDNF